MTTYFFYPKIVENKFLKEQADKDKMSEIDIADDREINTFENVEYKGLYDTNIPFTVKSKKAQILDDNPNLVYMTNMLVTLHTKDQRIIIITSLKGRYNKETFDLFFEKNVKVVDGETTVLAENLDLLSTKNTAAVYNNVFLTNDNGSLQADKVDYDFETKYYQISMFSNEKVKIKLIE